AAASTFPVTLGEQSDQIIISETTTVSLTNATLAVSLASGFTPLVTETFTIILNQNAASVISGTFAGLAEGDHITVGTSDLTISYQGGDGNDVTLTPNQAPVGVADAYVTAEDTPLTVITTTGVLTNDSDINGDAITATLETAPSDGVVVLATDGSFVYTPTLNFNGVMSFTYKANDGLLDSAEITVQITVSPTNDAPLAVADSYSTIENTNLVVSDAGTGGDRVANVGLLANDSDPDGTALSAELVSFPVNGFITLNANGTFFYAPETDFVGVDTFTYRAGDGELWSDPAVVTVTVSAEVGPALVFIEGWNLFGFPWQTDTAANALAPFDESYNIAWGFDDASDEWQFFEPALIDTAFEPLNTLSHLQYGEAYWIHITRPITVTGSGVSSLVGREHGANPPMQVYGLAHAAGITLTAKVADEVCAEGVSAEINGNNLFNLILPAACEGTVTLHTGNGYQTITWDNTHSLEIDLVSVPTAVETSGQVAVNGQSWHVVALLALVMLTGISASTFKRDKGHFW
ncbi:MAG TPA: tandem-95 repeat protein, partial [Anaerolineae bacterium]|nr:tandem-95 repeat protein [Anaerolineae bacterium]